MLFQAPYYAGGQIQGVFQTLQAWGFADALLPFILIFVLVFAILQKIEIFKEGTPPKPDRKINGIIAFVIAALVVIPHITRSYPPQADPVTIIMNFLPSTGILLLAIFVVMLLLGLVGAKIPSPILALIGFASLIILGAVIIKAAFPAFAPRWITNDPNTQSLIVILLTMGGVAWFILREPEPTKTWMQKIEELFK